MARKQAVSAFAIFTVFTLLGSGISVADPSGAGKSNAPQVPAFADRSKIPADGKQGQPAEAATLTGDWNRGKALFERQCRSCHGEKSRLRRRNRPAAQPDRPRLRKQRPFRLCRKHRPFHPARLHSRRAQSGALHAELGGQPSPFPKGDRRRRSLRHAPQWGSKGEIVAQRIPSRGHSSTAWAGILHQPCYRQPRGVSPVKEMSPQPVGAVSPVVPPTEADPFDAIFLIFSFALRPWPVSGATTVPDLTAEYLRKAATGRAEVGST
jgi:hypothetical protein